MMAAVLVAATVEAAPLRASILAGQSNMQGHASVTTFDYLAKDPTTASLLEEMRGKDGTPTVCDHVSRNFTRNRFPSSKQSHAVQRDAQPTDKILG
jgi:alpha-galactosidase